MTTAKAKAKDEPTKFSKAELIENAHVFDVKPEIVVGALYDKEEATKEEAAQAIKDFLTKPKQPQEEKQEAKGDAE
ncbi:hypothetical protein [Metabacillus fastidiosus]|uniref:hypothetical protein n=1 Tax=Metabacillus fastidiosus TaxID=1458 RepID=UPI003D2D0AA5